MLGTNPVTGALTAIARMNTRSQHLTTISISNVPVTMLIDSGSTCNIINIEYKEKLIEQGVKLLSCNRKTHPYSLPPICVHQLIRSNITLEDGNEIEVDFLPIGGAATQPSGKATAESLGLLKVAVCHVTGSDAYDDEVVRRFPKLWRKKLAVCRTCK